MSLYKHELGDTLLTRMVHSVEFKRELKREIDKLRRDEHIEIFKMIRMETNKFTENNNGIFINLKHLSTKTLIKIGNFVKYCKDNVNLIDNIENVHYVMEHKNIEKQQIDIEYNNYSIDTTDNERLNNERLNNELLDNTLLDNELLNNELLDNKVEALFISEEIGDDDLDTIYFTHQTSKADMAIIDTTKNIENEYSNYNKEELIYPKLNKRKPKMFGVSGRIIKKCKEMELKSFENIHSKTGRKKFGFEYIWKDSDKTKTVSMDEHTTYNSNKFPELTEDI